MAGNKFCHLHVHTQYSLLDGYGGAEKYVDKAKKLKMEYLACTDHGSIDGLIKFQKACDKQGIKPILGAEVYLVPDASDKSKGDSRGHATILIKNEEGFTNLCKMLTKANLEGYYYRPRIGYQDLIDHCSGLVVMTGCMVSFLNLRGGKEFFRDLLKVMPDDLYLEVMPHNVKDQIDINDVCIELANLYDVPLVATNDCHYIDAEDAEVQEVLLAIQTKAKWDDPGRFRFSFTGLHVRTSEEMIDAFFTQGLLSDNEIEEAMRSTIEIAQKCCNFRIKKQDIYLPIPPGFEGVNIEKYLWKELVKRLDFISREWTDNKYNLYYDRLVEEWDLINSKKFIGYFLIVKEIIEWCKKQGIMTGPGRGSVGGSLIAYLLNITTIDPIKYDLLFSRFIAEDREGFPDIDMDFPDNKRPLIREHLEELYGKNHISSISTFLTMKGRAALRDVARVFDVPLADVDPFAKILDVSDEEDGIIESALKTPEGRAFEHKYPKVVDLAIALEGQIRGAGQHAAAVVVSADDLTQGTRGNLSMRSQLVVSNWDMEDSEYVGLMKLDILGLNTLTVLNEVKRLIAKDDFDFELLEPNDPAVFDQLAQGNTVGVFQVNTYGGTKMCKDVKVKDFSMLCDVLALVRPGPADSGMTQEYIDRHRGKKWKRKHAEYEKIVKDTYGIIVYQEQIMQVIYKIAGLPYSVADKIRKIISKKRDAKLFQPYKEMFVAGCLKQGILNEDEANEFWTMLEFHSTYSFNKSHSVAYAMLSYWCAYAKHYYPSEFICAALTHSPESKKEELVKEARRLGLKIMLPRVGISQAKAWAIRDNELYVPFLEIKGIGEKGAEQCVDMKSREGGVGFFSTKKNKQTKIDKILLDIGAFGDPPQTDNIQQYFTFDVRGLHDEQYSKLRLLTRGIYEDLNNLISMKIPVRNYVKRVEGFQDALLADCSWCNLCAECAGPVLPSKGKYNIAIVGEAPGKDEDEEGVGFVGKAGNVLWDELDKYGLSRKMFHVTNVVKCYPVKDRTPTAEHIKTCKPWLLKELKAIEARFILAFGNTALKCFLGKDKGIAEKSGTIEWVESIGAWVCWCLHPSAILHNPNNKQIFIDGIKAFADKIYEMKITEGSRNG